MKSFLSALFFSALALSFALTSPAQTPHDTVPVPKSEALVAHPADSAIIDSMRKELEESRLAQMNLAMEVEQIKMAHLAADSVKMARQKRVIDSLRSITAGIPVIVDEDTLFRIYTNRGGLTPQQRAIQTAEKIKNIGKQYALKPDSVFVLSEEFTSDVMYESTVIISLTDKDALWEDMSREELAALDKDIIVKSLYKQKEHHGLVRKLKRMLVFTLIIAAQAALIWLTNLGYRKLKVKLHQSKQRFLKSIYIKDYELFSVQRQENMIFFFLNILRWLVIIVQFIISIPLLFSIFPETENLAMRLFSYIIKPVKGMWESIVNYIPNLFNILIIWLVIKYIVKGIGYLASEIQHERLKITGFYPDWAQPTFSITRFLLYAFMIALIYPLLPGSDSRVFQGISVFVGLVVSFGSSSAIGNLVSGIIITYMRPFKIGDRIQIKDVIGNVIEKTPIVTRIRTLKNEIITIPNSTIMNSQTTNLSESARTGGLIIHLDITMNYDTPWRRIHELLIEAALKTDGVMKNPHPFVLETSFDDCYVTYQINAYINNADQLSAITTALRQSIQDVFRAADISIMSPVVYSKYTE